jgi:uncharacterized protein (TIGR01777 family)
MQKEHPRRVVLAGGNGFLGQVLAQKLKAGGAEVIVLTRRQMAQEAGIIPVQWDGITLGPWTKHLEGAQAVLNLAGRSVNCRYHRRNRRSIMESRINSTRVLGEATAQCKRAPLVWLNSSTATIYKHSLVRPMEEADGQIGATPEAKDAFSVEVACEWEKTLNAACTPLTRKVAMRTAMVLGTAKGGVFDVLRRLTRFGLGGQMGNGQQFVSWIHEEDFCRAVDWLIAKTELAGPVNVCAPNPVTNQKLMAELRKSCRVPFGLPATRWMLEVGAFFLRTETELIIKSRCVTPGVLLASGFQFQFPSVPEALRDLCAKSSAIRTQTKLRSFSPLK